MNHPALLVSGTETVLVVSLQGQRPLEQVFLNAALVFALLLALLAAAAATLLRLDSGDSVVAQCLSLIHI